MSIKHVLDVAAPETAADTPTFQPSNPIALKTVAVAPTMETAGEQHWKPTPMYLALQSNARRRVERHLASIECFSRLSKANIRVRDNWRSLAAALNEVGRGERLRVREALADYYFEMRDYVLEWAGIPPESQVRYFVETGGRLRFWAPKTLCRVVEQV